MTSGSPRIPVIDVFAGPGGLSEGFWRTGRFDIRLSIEKDVHAYQTLKLRAFVHQFHYLRAPDDYYRLLTGEITTGDLYKLHPDAARAAEAEAWLAELGSASCADEGVDQRIVQALKGSHDGSWILIGGPPCQAYSLVGRSRRRNDPNFEKDPRHVLYRQYLRIIACHRPTVFVMENVTGILTSRLEGSRIFPRIVADLKDPGQALGIAGSAQYQLFSLRNGALSDDAESPWNFVLNAEDYGIPQARHRVILIGVRADVRTEPTRLRTATARATVADVLQDLPKLRSKLSKEEDSSQKWIGCLQAMAQEAWFKQLSDSQLHDRLCKNIRSLDSTLPTQGGSLCGNRPSPRLSKWILDNRVQDPPNHEVRGHMRTDLWRYLYAATFAAKYGRSPTIEDFPRSLWPHHANLVSATKHPIFGDRFRVQILEKPSKTIMAHISKDGHYYIHPDPLQCRSLTVREAARLQTFPDNYLFCGPRTEQYHQVGNAVPPLLAYQIALAVSHVFKSD